VGAQPRNDQAQVAGALLVVAVIGALFESWIVFLLVIVLGLALCTETGSFTQQGCGDRCRPHRKNRPWRR
jgi:hypothetical protein